MNANIKTTATKRVPATQILQRINEVQNDWNELEIIRRAAIGEQRRQQFLDLLGMNPTESPQQPVAA